VEYHYLVCDGPNCDLKLEMTNDDSGEEQSASDNQKDQPEGATPSGDPQVDTAQASDGDDSANGGDDSSAPSPWMTLDTGVQVFHFCSYDCLKALVNDPDSADAAIKRYQEFFGYDS